MEKIILDVDTDGGNGPTIPGVELIFQNFLHNKIPHRTEVMQKIYDILNS
jgi:hypothetical protein